MGRPRGSRNRRTLVREAKLRDTANGAVISMFYASEDDVKLDCLAVIKEAMWYFRRQALNGEKSGLKQSAIDNYYKWAANMADKVAPYYYPKLTAIKVSGDKDNPLNGKSRDELRAEVLSELQALGLFEDQLALPQGVANRDEK